jgi:arylsulfatase A-like enzyme
VDEANPVLLRRRPEWRRHFLARENQRKGGVRWQFHHVIDVVPTILEATGIPAPDMVDGIAQKPIEGVSMAYSFDKAKADAPTPHKTQYSTF